jgi:hypothetical protein
MFNKKPQCKTSGMPATGDQAFKHGIFLQLPDRYGTPVDRIAGRRFFTISLSMNNPFDV